ncbi:MAG: M20/M25/M40 family metallo-hydrolase [Flammeovirgaceae bacterium]|nr:M20/M25/M40 family metallo-hydrolase [Flammeovirgaceae bacterium]
MKIVLTLLLFTFSIPGFSQKKKIDLDQLTQEYAVKSFPELFEMLSIPNDAHFPGHIEANISWCEKAFQKRAFTTVRLNQDEVPLLLAERKVKKATKTVLIYLQIDGQPVDPSRWFQESPYKPTLKELGQDGKWTAIAYERLLEGYNPDWRIFARSASDAKGPAMAFIAALDAAASAGIEPNYNMKVILDFEEEMGSPHLPAAVTKYKSELSADMFIIYDGPRHISNKPTLTFGARGIADITLTTFGPRVPQHSGHYGNYAPNPAFRLSKILASMKDDDGRVIIPRFYDGVNLSDADKKILAMVPDDEAEIQKKIGIAKAEKVGNTYQESIQYPSINVRGMNSLFTGKEARTLVPATATAEIDVRLVPGSNAEELIGLIRKHIADQGYYLVEKEPTEEERMKYDKIAAFEYSVSYEAFQTPYESEVGIWLSKAMFSAFGKEPIKIRMAGGSIPISPFVTTLGVPAVTVPTVNADNNQHAPNENIRIGNYVDAVKTFIAILAEKL